MSEKKRLPPKQVGTYSKLNPQGFIEIIDEATGNVLAIQSEYGDVAETEFYETVNADGEKILLQKGVNPDSLPTKSRYPFSKVVADIICQKITEGMTLIEICNEKEMPTYATLCRWRRQHPEFYDQVEEARRDRAEYHRDMVIREAETASAESLSEAKVRIDAHKWAAGVGDSEKFGSKTKVVGDKDQPLTFVIDTGIRRPEDYNKDEALASRDVTPGEIDGETKSEAKDAGAAAGDNDIGDSEASSDDLDEMPPREDRGTEN